MRCDIAYMMHDFQDMMSHKVYFLYDFLFRILAVPFGLIGTEKIKISKINSKIEIQNHFRKVNL